MQELSKPLGTPSGASFIGWLREERREGREGGRGWRK
jgi:hypothetical protein